LDGLVEISKIYVHLYPSIFLRDWDYVRYQLGIMCNPDEASIQLFLDLVFYLQSPFRLHSMKLLLYWFDIWIEKNLMFSFSLLLVLPSYLCVALYAGFGDEFSGVETWVGHYKG